MADLALGSLTASTTIAGTDLLYAVIGGNSRKITLANFLTSPTLVTPALGVAAGTSLAIGGATIGSNALAVTGTAAISGNTTLGSSALLLWSTDTSLSRNSANALQIGNGSGGGSGYLLLKGLSVLNGGSSGFSIGWDSDAQLRGGSATSIGWTSGNVSSSLDSILSRNAAGVIQFGTTAANAAGSWLATSAGVGGTPAISASTHLNFSAGTTARSQARYAASTAPTSPVDGDFWFDGTDVKFRVAGATKTFTLV